VYEIEVRVLLAKGHMFDAGRCVELLKRLSKQSAEPLVELIAHTADLAVLGTAGDLVRAQQALDGAIAASRAARTPLREAWARLTWIDALRRADEGKVRQRTEAERTAAADRGLRRNTCSREAADKKDFCDSAIQPILRG
jgi:hypothetical protein